MSDLKWNEPTSVPSVALGTEERFWIAVASEYTGKTHVFLAHYQNRPYAVGSEDGADWVLMSEDGDYIHSVGWVSDKAHVDFENYYEQMNFSEKYKLLGWADYTPPEFKSPTTPACIVHTEGDMPRAYREIYEADLVEQGIDTDYPTIVGPDNFTCSLTEPEDRIWYRDLYDVVEKLNEQHETIATLQSQITQQEEALGVLREENEKLKRGLDAVDALISESLGVTGLHMNGDIAEWDSLLEGGFYEDWLIDYSRALPLVNDAALATTEAGG